MEINVNDSNFQKEVLESGSSVLVDFWAEWCMPCLMVAPTVEAIAKRYREKLKVCKVNVDEAPKVSSEYGIMSIPTLAIFKNGKMVDKVIGVLPETELASKVDAHI